MTHDEIRLECLKLALGRAPERASVPAGDVVAEAREFFAFVLGPTEAAVEDAVDRVLARQAGLRPKNVVDDGNAERLETAKYDGRRHWWRLHPTKGWRREAI